MRSVGNYCGVGMRDPFTGEIVEIDPSDFEDFAQRRRGLLQLIWLLVIAMAIALGLVLSYLVSVGAGLAAALAIALGGYEGQKRWNRSRWLKRFPQLDAKRVTWQTR